MTDLLREVGPPLTRFYGLTLRDLRDMTIPEIGWYLDYAREQAAKNAAS